MKLVLEQYIDVQRKWSEETFGPGRRLKGIISHIRKELDEIEESDGDLSEWIDVIILALDGAWRSTAFSEDVYYIGSAAEEIIHALIMKQRKNLKREWPDWRKFSEDEPIEHVR